jgi:hypothetical protein
MAVTIKPYSGSGPKWEWDGRVLKPYSGSGPKWEWDVATLKAYDAHPSRKLPLSERN